MNRHPAKKRTNPTNWMWLRMSVFGFVGFKLHLYFVFVSVFVLLSSLLSGQVLSCHCDGSGRRCIEVPSVGRSVGWSVARLSALFLSSSRFNTIYFFVYVCIYVYVCPPPGACEYEHKYDCEFTGTRLQKPNRFLAIIYLTMLLMQFPLHFATNIYKYSHIHTYIVHTYMHTYIQGIHTNMPIDTKSVHFYRRVCFRP